MKRFNAFFVILALIPGLQMAFPSQSEGYLFIAINKHVTSVAKASSMKMVAATIFGLDAIQGFTSGKESAAFWPPYFWIKSILALSDRSEVFSFNPADDKMAHQLGLSPLEHRDYNAFVPRLNMAADTLRSHLDSVDELNKIQREELKELWRVIVADYQISEPALAAVHKIGQYSHALIAMQEPVEGEK